MVQSGHLTDHRLIKLKILSKSSMSTCAEGHTHSPTVHVSQLLSKHAYLRLMPFCTEMAAIPDETREGDDYLLQQKLL